MGLESILIVVVVVVSFTVLLSMISIKKQKSSWTGVLEKKTYKEDYDTASEYYTLRFRTDEGKRVNVYVSRDMYNVFNIGDRATKKSGEAYPQKL